MAVKTLTDQSGIPYTLYYDESDLPYPVQPRLEGDYSNHLTGIRNLDIKDDDIIQLGYPKSGNHWLFEILTMLRYKSSDYTNLTLGQSIIDGVPLHELNSMTSPRVLVSHLWPHRLPKQLFEKKVKMILVMRNPKDLLISWYEFVKGITICSPYRGNFEDFFQLFLDGVFAHGSWIEYIRKCDEMISRHSSHPIHVVTYEEMKQHPVREVKRLCKFLGHHDVTDQFIHNVVRKTEFREMSTALSLGKMSDYKYIFDEGSPGLFRKGTVGEWRNRLTHSQNEKFDQHFQENTQDIKLVDRIRKYM